MRIDGDEVKFRNGRVSYANLGIIGLGKDGDTFVTSGGYDEGFPDGEPLTLKERVELAEHMMLQWKLFAAQEIKH